MSPYVTMKEREQSELKYINFHTIARIHTYSSCRNNVEIPVP